MSLRPLAAGTKAVAFLRTPFLRLYRYMNGPSQHAILSTVARDVKGLKGWAACCSHHAACSAILRSAYLADYSPLCDSWASTHGRTWEMRNVIHSTRGHSQILCQTLCIELPTDTRPSKAPKGPLRPSKALIGPTDTRP